MGMDDAGDGSLMKGSAEAGMERRDSVDLKDVDAAAPGGVYLCQVGKVVSCGACCGLYNTAESDRDSLTAMLWRRTRCFSVIPRELDAILGFAAEIRARESQTRPYPEFHHCPYIGMIGRDKSRVGCLLHPLADGNDGVDFRGISYYGGLACRTYFCSSCKCLKPDYKRILRAVADDWYTYGLIITETALVEAFFQELEDRLGRAIRSIDILGHGEREALIRRLIDIRRSWPHRAVPERFGNYFFEDRKYPKPPLEVGEGDEIGPRYRVIFRELASAFSSREQLSAAVGIFDDLFEGLVNMIQDDSG
jgi:hypothetical protein